MNPRRFPVQVSGAGQWMNPPVGMLMDTGLRLASPRDFVQAYEIGVEQFFLFLITMLITLANDLWIGVGVGLIPKGALRIWIGARLAAHREVWLAEMGG